MKKKGPELFVVTVDKILKKARGFAHGKWIKSVYWLDLKLNLYN
ncbi:hypothetical protein [Sinomicrobium sp. M5D2P9]